MRIPSSGYYVIDNLDSQFGVIYKDAKKQESKMILQRIGNFSSNFLIRFINDFTSLLRARDSPQSIHHL